MEDEEPDLAYEVGQLSEPFVTRDNTVWIRIEASGAPGSDELVADLITTAAMECRALLEDYGKPEARLEVLHEAASTDDDSEMATSTILEITTDEVTVEFVHDLMIDDLGPRFRGILDAAGRTATISTWNDGMLDWF